MIPFLDIIVYGDNTIKLRTIYELLKLGFGVMDDTGVKSSSYDVVKVYAENKIGKFASLFREE